MFDELSDLAFKRTRVQALGFYLAWLFLTILVAILLSFIATHTFLASPEMMATEQFEMGLRIGGVLAIAFCMGLSYVVARAKGAHMEYKTLLLVVLAGLLASLGGGLLGLVIPSYLTTREKVQS